MHGARSTSTPGQPLRPGRSLLWQQTHSLLWQQTQSCSSWVPAHLAQQRRGSGRGQAGRAVELHHLRALRQHALRRARPRGSRLLGTGRSFIGACMQASACGVSVLAASACNRCNIARLARKRVCKLRPLGPSTSQVSQSVAAMNTSVSAPGLSRQGTASWTGPAPPGPG